ncbi:ComF family protein, partial [bacterium]|nr:ComF family protein [bacterium]
MTELALKNKLTLQITSLFWKSMDWLYPPRCCNCDRRGFVLCDECFSDIEHLTTKYCIKCGYPIRYQNRLCKACSLETPLYTQMRSWAVFSGSVRTAIHSLKYKRNLALGNILAKPLIEVVEKSGWQIDLVVPVPLSKSRMQSRGYNQAALISRYLAASLNIPHSSHDLRRIKNTFTQTKMNVNKRFTNLLDAFYANPATLKKKNILIIDDVITTGATMRNCTNALLAAGAEKIYCLSVARAI